MQYLLIATFTSATSHYNMMLYDVLGISKDKLDHFFANPSSYFKVNNKIYRHINTSDQKSVSLKFDKYIYEQTKKYVESKNPKQSILAHKSINQLLQGHVSNTFILVTDIKNYFNSISFIVFKQLVNKNNSLYDRLDEIRKIYFINDFLIKGLMASPILSEIIGLKIDNLINQIIYSDVEKYDLKYTRYYDDIIVSSNNIDRLILVYNSINEIFKNTLKLELNNKKTRIQSLKGASVLGLRFYDDSIRVPGKYRNELRGIIYRYKFLKEDSQFEIENKIKYVNKIKSSINYVIYNSPNEIVDSYKIQLVNFNEEHKRLADKLTYNILDSFNDHSI